MDSQRLRPLHDDLKKKIHLELYEVDNRLQQDIDALREWIIKQPHLKARMDDRFLLAFLRGSKYSLEEAKSKIDYFYTIKTMMPEVFKNLLVDQKCKELIRTGALLWPQKPENFVGPEITITRFSNDFDYKRFKLIDIIRLRSLALEYALSNIDNYVISGYYEIFDLANISLSLYAQIDLAMAKKLSLFCEKALPIPLKGIHIINCPKEGLDALQFIRTLIPDKYKRLFYIHKNIKEIFKYVPQEFLPKEYGGKNKTADEIAAENERLLEDFNEYYLENDVYGVDEKLRPMKLMDEKTLFGLEGSFRKLNID